MDAAEQLYAGEMGTVHSSGEAAVYLPESMELPKHTAIPQAVSTTLETPAAAIRFPAESAAARPHGERALLLAVLKDRLPRFRFRHEDADIERPRTARVPVQSPRAGRRRGLLSRGPRLQTRNRDRGQTRRKRGRRGR
jgi:hypothetical protein